MSCYGDLPSTIGEHCTTAVIESNPTPSVRKLGIPSEWLTPAVTESDNTWFVLGRLWRWYVDGLWRGCHDGLWRGCHNGCGSLYVKIDFDLCMGCEPVCICRHHVHMPRM